jgi:hypothetical protein
LLAIWLAFELEKSFGDDADLMLEEVLEPVVQKDEAVPLESLIELLCCCTLQY